MRWSAARRRVIFVVAFLATAGGAKLHADAPDDVVARCGEADIKRQEVDGMLRRIGFQEQGDEGQRHQAEAAVLEQLIDERILRDALIRADMGVEPEAVTTAIDRLRQQVTAQGKDFDAFLEASGRTIDSLREQAALEMALEKYVRPRLTDEAIKRVFEANRRELDGTRLRVSHVILRPDGAGDANAVESLLKRAGDIRDEIVQGRISFADAAKQYSAGPSRLNGGDIGWIVREGPMVDGFSTAAFALAKGGVSEPFVTTFGVHLATVTAVEPGRIGPTAVRGRLEKIVASEIVRGLVAEGRHRTTIWFAPGVPHFDPATLGEPAASRRVVIVNEGE